MLVHAPWARTIHKQEKERWLIHCAVSATLAGEKVTIAHESPEAAERFEKAVAKELQWLLDNGIISQSSYSARNADSPLLSGSTRSSPNP